MHELNNSEEFHHIENQKYQSLRICLIEIGYQPTRYAYGSKYDELDSSLFMTLCTQIFPTYHMYSKHAVLHRHT